MNDSLARFTRASQTAADSVIRTYSTSFGVATRLLGARHRTYVRSIYAMVRVADEIVDGVGHEAGLDTEAQRDQLRAYAAQAKQAVETGCSSDLVLHAFAQAARASSIGADLMDPFFASMEADLTDQASQGLRVYDGEDYRRYVYGSAEVVGLMCLKVFLRQERLHADQTARLEHGARQLGAAFQNVNFLRDLADDTERLNRSYLTAQAQLTEDDKQDWVRRIAAQLDDAEAAVPLLPKDARAAVRAALALFEELNRRLQKTSVTTLYRRRVRVPDALKGIMAARAVAQTYAEVRT